MREFTTAHEEIEIEDGADEKEDPFVDFSIDGRVMKSYIPNESQVTYMLASMGRGASDTERVAAMVAVIFETLPSKDQDYLADRMLSRGKNALPPEMIEEIFEYLVEAWFGTPTQESSDSAPTPPNTGQNSKVTTTKSTTSSDSDPGN